MPENTKDEFCLDCNKLLEQPIPGFLPGAWLRTDGNKDVTEGVPGGVVYGKKLGFVCNDCSAWGQDNE